MYIYLNIGLCFITINALPIFCMEESKQSQGFKATLGMQDSKQSHGSKISPRNLLKMSTEMLSPKSSKTTEEIQRLAQERALVARMCQELNEYTGIPLEPKLTNMQKKNPDKFYTFLEKAKKMYPENNTGNESTL